VTTIATRGIGLAALLAAVVGAGGARAAPKGSPWGAGYFPNVVLTTQDGRQVRFYDDLVQDRHVVVSFVFTRCTRQCGLITANLARVYRLLGDRMGKDLHFYSISMDPEHDTPEVLRTYAAAFKAGPGWTFLTGKKEDVALLRKKFGDISEAESHSANILIGNDATGSWMATGALDNPQYLSMVIGDWLDPNWKYRAPAKSYAEAPQRVVAPSKAETSFRGKCAACHEADGKSVGPDLAGVVARRGKAWLTRWLVAPEKLVAEKDPVALEIVGKYGNVPMPNLDLTEAEAAAVVEYLEAREANRPRG
jgi:cytochrome oxidase Cu insertion factor (SCO1/SenC/PrrC family)/cytochrome c551/c552